MTSKREELHHLINNLPDTKLYRAKAILERFAVRYKAGIETVVIEIEGCVETTVPETEWTDAFLAWLESRGEYFGGGIKDVSDQE